LVRELKEEFSITVGIEDFFAESIHTYPDRTIQLLAFIVRWVDGAMVLVDHDMLEWVAPAQLNRFEMLPADRPLVDKLVQNF
jgi:8-oxo-dGTP diphosphatase